MHVARKKWLLQDAIGFARKGGFIDVTSGGICDFSSPADAVEILLMRRFPHLLTMSTDGHGSKPRFNENGELIGLRCGGVTGNLDIVRELIGRGHAPEKILPLVTSNVADALGLGGKEKYLLALMQIYASSILIVMGNYVQCLLGENSTFQKGNC